MPLLLLNLQDCAIKTIKITKPDCAVTTTEITLQDCAIPTIEIAIPDFANTTTEIVMPNCATTEIPIADCAINMLGSRKERKHMMMHFKSFQIIYFCQNTVPYFSN